MEDMKCATRKRCKQKNSKSFSFLQRRFKSDGALHHKDNHNHIVAELDMDMRNTIRSFDTFFSSTEPSIFIEPTLEV